MGIFKAYDIRGVYKENLDEDIVYKIGRAYVRKFKPKKITIGRDMRVSSPSLFDAIVRGVTDEGCDVVDVGLVSTPMMYFSVWNYGYDGGLMVSASHNPGKYNGVKMVLANAVPISGETGIYEIGEKINDLPAELAEKKGNVEKLDVFHPYIEHSVKFVDKSRLKRFKIVMDTANGMGGPKAAEFFKNVDCDLIHMYSELDGNFPNHEANPLEEENMKDLQDAVRKEGADIGIAFDGDADRVFFTDETGEIVPCDMITALIARRLLIEEKGLKIAFDVRSSKVIGEVVSENGGSSVRCHVGHSLVKSQMRKEGIKFGGELSGHFYLEDEHYAEAPFFVIATVLEAMSEGKKLSELINPLKRYVQSGEVNSKVEDKEGKMKALAEKYKDGKISWLDGVTVEFDDWWFNVRPSNTEPYLRLNLEANTKELMEEKRDEVLNFIRG